MDLMIERHVRLEKAQATCLEAARELRHDMHPFVGEHWRWRASCRLCGLSISIEVGPSEDVVCGQALTDSCRGREGQTTQGSKH